MDTHSRTPVTALDIWALGIVVFQACFDMHPFLPRSFTDIFSMQNQISILSRNGFSFAAYKDLIRKDGNFRKLMKFEEK